MLWMLPTLAMQGIGMGLKAAAGAQGLVPKTIDHTSMNDFMVNPMAGYMTGINPTTAGSYDQYTTTEMVQSEKARKLNMAADIFQMGGSLGMSALNLAKVGGGAEAKSGIYIKPSKRGSFTAWCKRHGYGGVTAACKAAGKRSKSAAIRKKATFATNAAKWKKAEDGLMVGEEEGKYEIVDIQPIRGESHEEGGEDMNINGKNVEAEGGEYLVKFKDGSKAVFNKEQMAALKEGTPVEEIIASMPKVANKAQDGVYPTVETPIIDLNQWWTKGNKQFGMPTMKMGQGILKPTAINLGEPMGPEPFGLQPQNPLVSATEKTSKEDLGMPGHPYLADFAANPTLRKPSKINPILNLQIPENKPLFPEQLEFGPGPLPPVFDEKKKENNPLVVEPEVDTGNTNSNNTEEYDPIFKRAKAVQYAGMGASGINSIFQYLNARQREKELENYPPVSAAKKVTFNPVKSPAINPEPYLNSLGQSFAGGLSAARISGRPESTLSIISKYLDTFNRIREGISQQQAQQNRSDAAINAQGQLTASQSNAALDQRNKELQWQQDMAISSMMGQAGLTETQAMASLMKDVLGNANNINQLDIIKQMLRDPNANVSQIMAYIGNSFGMQGVAGWPNYAGYNSAYGMPYGGYINPNSYS